jgi:hypothetical protein
LENKNNVRKFLVLFKRVYLYISAILNVFIYIGSVLRYGLTSFSSKFRI